MQPCSCWKYDTLRAIVESGIAYFEDVKGMQILVNYPILLYIIQLPHALNIYGDDFSLIILIMKRRSKTIINRIDFSP